MNTDRPQAKAGLTFGGINAHEYATNLLIFEMIDDLINHL
jgi:hypothetical protein